MVKKIFKIIGLVLICFVGFIMFLALGTLFSSVHQMARTPMLKSQGSMVYYIGYTGVGPFVISLLGALLIYYSALKKRVRTLWFSIPVVLLYGFAVFSYYEDFENDYKRSTGIQIVKERGAKSMDAPKKYTLPSTSNFTDTDEVDYRLRNPADIISGRKSFPELSNYALPPLPQFDPPTPEQEAKWKAVRDKELDEIAKESQVYREKRASGELPDCVNINEASVAELSSVDYLGVNKSEIIIMHRDEGGPFTSLELLKEYEILTERQYNRVKDSLCIQ